jgi:lipopolysaccharide export LptBFGC system permease protein LptF
VEFSIFEAVMLLCFGAAWPLSIIKSFKSRRTAGKSLGFLLVILVGYLSGFIHKLLYSMDTVIGLYAFNASMVIIDICLYLRNTRYERVLERVESVGGVARPSECPDSCAR